MIYLFMSVSGNTIGRWDRAPTGIRVCRSLACEAERPHKAIKQTAFAHVSLAAGTSHPCGARPGHTEEDPDGLWHRPRLRPAHGGPHSGGVGPPEAARLSHAARPTGVSPARLSAPGGDAAGRRRGAGPGE